MPQEVLEKEKTETSREQPDQEKNPEEPKKDIPENQTQPEAKDEKTGAFLSPAALVMLPLALIADISEFLVALIPFAGQILAFIVDIAAIAVIGGWMWFRSGTITVSRGAEQRTAKTAKWAKRLKWLRPLLFILEFIPIVGSLPLWVLAVYLELKHNN